MLLLAAAIAVSASFEGGSIGRVENLAPNHLRCSVSGQADQNNRNRQANRYYFRLDNLPRQEVGLVDGPRARLEIWHVGGRRWRGPFLALEGRGGGAHQALDCIQGDPAVRYGRRRRRHGALQRQWLR